MKKIILLIALTSLNLSFAEKLKGTYFLPAVDIAAEKNKAIASKDVPLKYAVATEIDDIYHLKGQSQTGEWIQKFDRSWEYHLRLESKNATSLNVGFTDFFLPHSAELWVSTDDQSIMRGPYNDTYNKNHGFFWVGDVPADHMNIKITVSDKEKPYLSFNVNKITRGFHKFWEEPNYKSGSCNVDVACPESQGWENEIATVGRYTFSTSGGSFLCTGQLLNNTAQDGKPIFSTADHCGYSSNGGQSSVSERQNVAASIALTWNYQSQTCRAPGSSQSGTSISTNGFNDRQSGATYLASNPDSDFALVELNQAPSPGFNVEFSGWDRTDTAPNSAVAIHHPSGHAKRISFENNPLSITTYLSTVQGAGTHLRVADWDLGTTEGGSSGSGLWNANHLFVGQLHGGFASCSNDDADWYGRLAYSWDNGNDAQSRMKDWLDPLNTGQMTLQGSAGCEAPTISINNNSSNQVGDLLTFTSQVSGGSGGYSYEWNIDGDEYADGFDADIDVRYAEEYVGNITLTVKDSTGCQTTSSQAVVIEGPEVKLQNVQNIRQNLDQVCGNNDNVIDPGERWKTTLFTENSGNKTATDTYLALSLAKTTTADAASDNYGNTYSNCDRLFIDISNTGTLQTWISGGTQYPADDEGHTALIQLNQSFDHFGDNVASLVASSNGYLSSNPNATGADWDNDCPLPQTPDKDNVGARISPLHDDLKGSQFYHQYFSTCPRASETGTNLACEVFLWKGADLWATSSETEAVDIQAILYPATGQWVYQYDGSGFDGSTSTTGIQNSQATDGRSFACNTPNSINTSEAVCIFNKNHQPQFNGADFVKLETPVIELGDLSPNQSQSSELIFSVTTEASCGSEFAINHDASVYDEGFNPGQSNVFTGTIGNNGQCNVVLSCPISTENNFIEPRDGLWWNSKRAGNGTDLHVSNQSSMLYVMYTGRKDRSPVWYIAPIMDDSFYNQYYNDLYQVNYPGGFNSGSSQVNQVGWSTTTFLSANEAIQVREINNEIFAEKITWDQFAVDQTPNMHTGHYFAQTEGGWGQSIITLNDTQVAIGYIYDLQGNPFWTIGSGNNDDSIRTVYTGETFCPTCPFTPMKVHSIGTIRQSFNGQMNGTIHEYQVEYPDGASQPKVIWNKNNLDIINLVPQNN